MELTREAARRFNHLYGREPDFEAKLAQSLKKLAKPAAKALQSLRKAYQESGSQEALQQGLALVAGAGSLGKLDQERLESHLRGTGKQVLVEPQVLLTQASKLPGLDGAKMSKSYNNSIAMREDKTSVEQKVRRMPTDPARVRRSDPGDPEKCPVWQFHRVYSDAPTQQWVIQGCKSAGIGCLECKQPVIDGILKEQQPMLERAEKYVTHPKLVRDILDSGTDRARIAARATMADVRDAIGLNY